MRSAVRSLFRCEAEVRSTRRQPSDAKQAVPPGPGFGFQVPPGEPRGLRRSAEADVMPYC
jgi:hypothetical protein